MRDSKDFERPNPNQDKKSLPSFSQRVLLFLLFVIALTFFLHFREERMEVLELGGKANRYIIAQIDFEFADDEATLISKQEALRDVGAIYKIDEKEILERCNEFENNLIHDQHWREKLPNATFEEMYRGLDDLQRALLQSRFTNRRTFQKMKELNLPIHHFYLFSPSDIKAPQALPAPLWKDIEQNVFRDQAYPPEIANFILISFEKMCWNLQEDVPTERNLRQLAQDRVPEKYTKVKAGSRIIDSGEKISARHIAMLQAMKQGLREQRNLWKPSTLVGSFLLSLIFTALCVIYFRLFHRPILQSLRKLTLLVTIVIFTLALAKLTEYFLLNHNASLIEFFRYPILVPFATVLVCVLIGSEIALFTSGFLVIVVGITLAIDHDRFLVINLTSAIVAIMFARSLHKRKEIFLVFAKIWLSCIPVILAFNFIEDHCCNLTLIADFLSSFLCVLFMAILVVGLFPVLESVFQVMTDMTLMEYMDPDNLLLKRLSLEAPGTYQHCLVVGSLAEAGARAIGADGLFCRVATLYHDIGKLFNPHYFTENQLGGFNIHQLLTPYESSQVIIAHVIEGEELARKYHLPQNFIDIIREHHGTTLVYYFYCKQVELMGGDVTKVDEKRFRYPGPKPHSKESAIIMIADTVEAASRSMEELNEKSITETVEKLVSEKADDGQFDECQLTFEELGTVKRAMVKALLVSRHLRVKYPTHLR